MVPHNEHIMLRLAKTQQDEHNQAAEAVWFSVGARRRRGRLGLRVMVTASLLAGAVMTLLVVMG